MRSYDSYDGPDRRLEAFCETDETNASDRSETLSPTSQISTVLVAPLLSWEAVGHDEMKPRDRLHCRVPCARQQTIKETGGSVGEARLRVSDTREPRFA